MLQSGQPTHSSYLRASHVYWLHHPAHGGGGGDGFGGVGGVGG